DGIRDGHVTGVQTCALPIWGISLFDSHDVSLTRTAWRVPRAPGSVDSSALQKARTDGHYSQSALELGHHQAARSREMDVLLSVRHPRCLQPLRHRLDGHLSRKRGTGQATDRGELQETTHPAWSTHAPCGSWHVDEVQASSFSTRRSSRHENA